MCWRYFTHLRHADFMILTYPFLTMYSRYAVKCNIPKRDPTR